MNKPEARACSWTPAIPLPAALTPTPLVSLTLRTHPHLSSPSAPCSPISTRAPSASSCSIRIPASGLPQARPAVFPLGFLQLLPSSPTSCPLRPQLFLHLPPPRLPSHLNPCSPHLLPDSHSNPALPFSPPHYPPIPSPRTPPLPVTGSRGPDGEGTLPSKATAGGCTQGLSPQPPRASATPQPALGRGPPLAGARRALPGQQASACLRTPILPLSSGRRPCWALGPQPSSSRGSCFINLPVAAPATE